MSASSKSTSTAFLLWFFLGFTGVYRMYLGRLGSGLAMLALTVFAAMGNFSELIILVLGVFWLVDAFRISGMANEMP